MNSSRFLSQVGRIVVLCCLLGVCGCQRVDDPGLWSKEDIIKKMEERCEVTEVNLSATEEGFEGTGKRADGETLTFTIEQDPVEGRLAWEAKGDRGFVETYEANRP